MTPGYFTTFAAPYATPYFPGSGAGGAVPTPPYVPPSPTGWKSTATRTGPDPNFTTALRKAGEA